MADDALLLGVAEELAAGTVACAAVSDQLARMTQINPKRVRLVHFLHHYVADEDVRARDTGYAQWQLAQLRQLIAESA